jgi:RNA polymerase sigma-70 factor (ECF subfamily)
MFDLKKNKHYTDEQLVKKSLQNMDFFGVLFERYEKKLLRYILRISNFSYDVAEEILQECFVKAWENLNGFDEDLKFSSWIYRIVHNKTISEWKKTTTKGRDLKIDLESEVFNNIASELDIENDLNKEYTRQEVKKVLAQLDEKYREVLVLKFLEEKSYDEISDILKKPAGTVATLINRAKKKFKSLLHNKDELSF